MTVGVGYLRGGASHPTAVDPAGDSYLQYGSEATNPNSKLIPQFYSNKILKRFYEKIIYTAISNTDYEGEIKGKGDTVFIRQAPEVAIDPHQVGDVIDYQLLDSIAKELNIDQSFRWAFKMYDEDEVQIDINAANLATETASTRLQIQVEKDVMQFFAQGVSPLNSGQFAGLESGTGGGQSVVAGGADVANSADGIDLGYADNGIAISSTNATDYLVYLNQVLDEQNIPNEGRWAVIPSWYASRLKLGDLKAANVTGDGTGVIRSGLIGKIDNTMIYVCNNLYTEAELDGKHTFVMCGTNHASTFAAQISKSDRLQIQDQFGWFYRGLFVYGRQVVQPEALSVLRCRPA